MPSVSELTALIRRLIDRTQDTVAAAKLLEAEAQKDDALFRMLTECALRDACLAQVRRVQVNDRKALWSTQKPGANYPGEPSTEIVTAGPVTRGRPVPLQDWSSAVERGFLQVYRLPGGKRLGLATASDLLVAVEQLEMPAFDMLAKGRWLRRIRDGMPNDDARTVESVYSEADVVRLRDETKDPGTPFLPG